MRQSRIPGTIHGTRAVPRATVRRLPAQYLALYSCVEVTYGVARGENLSVRLEARRDPALDDFRLGFREPDRGSGLVPGVAATVAVTGAL